MSTHWMDQCPNFTSMSPSDCVKVVKEDHSCFYFLKRAGFQLLRRCQCSESFQGNQCKYFHHPLIHIANAKNSASTLTVSADDQFFPSHWKSWDQETKKKTRKSVPGLWCSGQLNHVVSSRRTRSQEKGSKQTSPSLKSEETKKNWQRSCFLFASNHGKLKFYPHSYPSGHSLYKQWHYWNKAQSRCWNLWSRKRGNP